MKSRLLLLLLLITHIAVAQLQNNVWCFGQNAGLDFNSGTPVALASTAINTAEGCASIADNTGNLLFYTDGIFAWNRNHIQMPNGFGMLGDPSTTQSALIVPMPGNATKYYIFAIGALSAPMTYSIVDMSLQGGFGDVTATKNVPFHPLVAEKQCAIQRCDGNIWILSCEYNTNTFYADLITPAGIQPSVLSSVGMVQTGGGGPGWNAVGYLKASQQGDRLALAIRDFGTFEVFNFNVNTGIVSNPISITNNNWSALYGVEFSPDGSKLYGSLITSDVVYQFDLLAGTQAAITASATVVANTSGWACALQLASDGKIYVAEPLFGQFSPNSFMGVISSPNTLGLGCNYITNAVNLGANGCLLGLPCMMVKVTGAAGVVSITGNSSICPGQSTTLTASGATTYQWSGGGVNATSNSITVSPASATQYFVTGTTSCGSSVDSVTVTIGSVPSATIAGNLAICSGQSTTLTASGATSYQWSGGSTATTAAITVSPTATTSYTVTPSNGGCAGAPVNVSVAVTPTPVAAIASTSNSICSGQTATLTCSGGTTYQWSGGSNSTTPIINVSPTTNTTYTLQAINGNCTDTATVSISVTATPVAVITGNQAICAGQSTTLTASGATSYQWSGGSTATTAAITVSPAATTTYTVTPSNGICVGTPANATVMVNPIPTGSISASINSICPGQTVTLTAAGGGTYQWSGGGVVSTLTSINVTPPNTTTYYLQTSNGFCVDNDSVVIQVNGVTVITGNQIICFGESTTLVASGANTYQWSGGSNATTASITVSPIGTTTYYVAGTSACGTFSDTAIVTVNPPPVIDIVNQYTEISAGLPVQLVATGGVNYLWTTVDNINCLVCPNPIVLPTDITTYTVTGTDANGCSSSDTVTVNPIYDELFIPNCVTINADGTNDIFYAYGINIKTLNMRVYDRWGELIFESNEKTKGWDATFNGQLVKQDVYVYTVHCEWVDGKTSDRKGIVTVVE